MTNTMPPRIATIPVYFRDMGRQDYATVMDIERTSFAYPWSVGDFEWMRLRQARRLVAMNEYDCPIGYIVYDVWSGGIVVHNLAVAKSMRRVGVGARLIERASRDMTKFCSQIIANVCESNIDAQLFFRDQGFVASRILYGEYDEVDELAYQFVRRREWAE